MTESILYNNRKAGFALILLEPTINMIATPKTLYLTEPLGFRRQSLACYCEEYILGKNTTFVHSNFLFSSYYLYLNNYKLNEYHDK